MKFLKQFSSSEMYEIKTKLWGAKFFPKDMANEINQLTMAEAFTKFPILIKVAVALYYRQLPASANYLSIIYHSGSDVYFVFKKNKEGV